MYFIGYLYQYVDYHMGAESRHVRFEQPEMVQKARAAAVLAEEGGLVVKNYIAVLEAVEGMCIFFCGCVVCCFVVACAQCICGL